MDRLVDFLASGAHPVTLDRYADAQDIAGALHDGVLLLRCTDTQGGTELACEVRPAGIAAAAAAIGEGAAAVEIAGHLTLNDVDLEVTVMVEAAAQRGEARFALR